MRNNRLMIRADGNAEIGAGHIMRCLSIAASAMELGAECIFVTADKSYDEVINKAGVSHKILNTQYSDMKGELNTLCNLVSAYAPHILLIDSYSVTDYYLRELRKQVKIAYIDDLKTKIYPVDFIINYNISAISLGYLDFYKICDEMPHFLLGQQYAPLRKEFQGLNEIPTKYKVSNILFSAGGADPERIVIKFIKNLIHHSELMRYTFHLVLGKYEPDIEEIWNICKKYQNLIPHINVGKMAELMRYCDIAVSAAGSTLYELAACGVPTITYILEDNQIIGAKSFEDNGIMINAGDIRGNDAFFEDSMIILNNLCGNYQKRLMMHQNSIQFIDGNGANRLVQKLLMHS